MNVTRALALPRSITKENTNERHKSTCATYLAAFQRHALCSVDALLLVLAHIVDSNLLAEVFEQLLVCARVRACVSIQVMSVFMCVHNNM
jgi:hypothetical protein